VLQRLRAARTGVSDSTVIEDSLRRDLKLDLLDELLIALAVERSAYLVTGDQHLLTLEGDLPIYSPAEFLAILNSER